MALPLSGAPPDFSCPACRDWCLCPILCIPCGHRYCGVCVKRAQRGNPTKKFTCNECGNSTNHFVISDARRDAISSYLSPEQLKLQSELEVYFAKSEALRIKDDPSTARQHVYPPDNRPLLIDNRPLLIEIRDDIRKLNEKSLNSAQVMFLIFLLCTLMINLGFDIAKVFGFQIRDINLC